MRVNCPPVNHVSTPLYNLWITSSRSWITRTSSLNIPRVVGSALKLELSLKTPPTLPRRDRSATIQDSRTFLPSIRDYFTLIILFFLHVSFVSPSTARDIFNAWIISTFQISTTQRHSSIQRWFSTRKVGDTLSNISEIRKWESRERDKVRLKSHRAYPTRSRHSSRNSCSRSAEGGKWKKEKKRKRGANGRAEICGVACRTRESEHRWQWPDKAASERARERGIELDENASRAYKHAWHNRWGMRVSEGHRSSSLRSFLPCEHPVRGSARLLALGK